VLRAVVPDPALADLWPGERPPVEVHVWDLRGEPPVSPHLLVTPYAQDDGRFGVLAGLRDLVAVQTLSAGVDHVRPWIPDGVTLCNAAGVHEAGTAELAVGLALSALRGVGRYTPEEICGGSWPPPFRPALADRRAIVLGAGRIGLALAARLAPFEVEVTLVAQHERETPLGHVHPIEELTSLLPRHDAVFLTLPLTERSRHLVDRAFLAALPDGALLVNVGRGALVDTDALVAELARGRLLAALDVTDPEPLPRDHALWSLPGVVITPHVGGASSAFLPRARRLIRTQLELLSAGKELLNAVR
jgi:phosphoglycerate dehydrogenase-like enzyme